MSRFILLIVFFCSALFVQQATAQGKLNTEQFLHSRKTQEVVLSRVRLSMISSGSFFFRLSEVQHNELPVLPETVHYTALFCKLETVLHHHFNIWLKFRAGDDDQYRKLTAIN